MAESSRNFERERGRPVAKREHSRGHDEHLPPHQRRRHVIKNLFSIHFKLTFFF